MRRLVINMRDRRPIWRVPAWAEDEIRAALPNRWQATVVQAPVDSRGDGTGVTPEAIEAVRGAEIYLGAGVPPEILDAASELRWAHTMSAGVAGSLSPAMRASDVMLTNSAAIHAEPVAATALAMMLYFTRGLDFATRAQHEGRWDKAPFDAADTPVDELGAQTLGIVGFGGIGRALAHRASALGMRVLASKRTPAEPPAGVELHTGDEALEELLEASDALVLTLPETLDTRGMIGRRELEAMGDDAVLINVARGGIVDQDALIDALRDGQLRGAALDVFRREPLPPDSPLWELDNVLITPHVSSTTPHYWRRETDLILDNIDRYLAGRPLRNVVDKQAGY